MTDLNEKLTKVKVRALLKKEAAFLVSIGTGMRHFIDDSFPTACVDDTSITWGRRFLESLTINQAVFVYLHECYHKAMNHVQQTKDLGLAADSRLCNIAQDYRINYDLVKLIGNPDIPYMVYSTKYTEEYSWVDIYNELKKEQQNSNLPTKDFIQNKFGLPSDCFDHMDMNTSIDPQKLNDELYRAQEYAKSCGQTGSIPKAIQNLLTDLFVSKLNPKRMLSKYFNTEIRTQLNFRKPDKRFNSVFLPTRSVKERVDIAVMLDISGSITQEQLKDFYNECLHLIKSKHIKKLTLVQFNHSIVSVKTVSTYDSLLNVPIHKSGGTVISPVFSWIKENNPSVSIVFTDGLFTQEPEPTKKIIWCISNNTHFTSKNRVIHYG